MAEASSASTTTTSSSSLGNEPQQQQQQHDSGNGAILSRLKELESTNQSLQKSVEDGRAELHRREEKIKELSIEKRKEMEEMIRTAIDSWLNGMPELSEEVRKQFRTGISRIAETVDTKNAAWEVVCNASKLHTSNVNRIEELINTCNQQSETIKTLVGGNGTTTTTDPAFANENSRMQKRPRGNELEPAIPIPSSYSSSSTAATNAMMMAPDSGGASSSSQQQSDAWDAFGGLLMQHGKQTYGW
jgi:hypothetical protein